LKLVLTKEKRFPLISIVISILLRSLLFLPIIFVFCARLGIDGQGNSVILHETHMMTILENLGPTNQWLTYLPVIIYGAFLVSTITFGVLQIINPDTKLKKVLRIFFVVSCILFFLIWIDAQVLHYRICS